MKDEDIKLPKMPNLANSMSWNNDLEEWARQAVRMNMPQPKQSDQETFDLARAMAGEPIVTRDGRKARFVAHVPELTSKGARVLVLVSGDDHVSYYWETGFYEQHEQSEYDLFMAPKPKRTVWVNVWCLGGDVGGGVHASKENAILTAENNGEYVHIAMPIEIDA